MFVIANNAMMKMFISTLFLRICFRNETITSNMDIYKASDAYCWIAFPRAYYKNYQCMRFFHLSVRLKAFHIDLQKEKKKSLQT